MCVMQYAQKTVYICALYLYIIPSCICALCLLYLLQQITKAFRSLPSKDGTHQSKKKGIYYYNIVKKVEQYEKLQLFRINQGRH